MQVILLGNYTLDFLGKELNSFSIIEEIDLDIIVSGYNQYRKEGELIMAESKYEKYIVRKPAMLIHEKGEYGTGVYKEIIPENKKMPGLYIHENESGIQIAMAKGLIPETKSTVEYGLIWGDTAFGVKSTTTRPHKHDYDEIFLFIGTNTDDVDDLGAEIEFWLGEGDDLEGVIFNTSSCMFLPAHRRRPQ